MSSPFASVERRRSCPTTRSSSVTLPGADLAAGGRQLLDEQLADRVAIAAQRRRARRATRRARARSRPAAPPGGAARSPRGGATSPRADRSRRSLHHAAASSAGCLGELARPRAARRTRRRGTRARSPSSGSNSRATSRALRPAREPRLAGAAPSSRASSPASAIAAEIDAEIRRHDLRRDPRLAQLAAQRELGVQLLQARARPASPAPIGHSTGSIGSLCGPSV